MTKLRKAISYSQLNSVAPVTNHRAGVREQYPAIASSVTCRRALTMGADPHSGDESLAATRRGVPGRR